MSHLLYIYRRLYASQFIFVIYKRYTYSCTSKYCNFTIGGKRNSYHRSVINTLNFGNPLPNNKHASNKENVTTQDIQFNDKIASEGELTFLKNNVNDYTTRTHTCGELRASDVGEKVKLCGWVKYVRLDKFILIGDAYGITQIIFNEQDKNNSIFTGLYLESIISVTGIVCRRPTHQIVKKYTTGEIEVVAKSAHTLNKAMPILPFHIRDYNKACEQKLNRHRYLALRYPPLQYNLRLRSKMVFRMREFLITKKHFVEVETPTLFKKTPGGAQEFVVPTQFENKFYSLVQSPQQLKQLLMVASIDRYFQIARCYRDEKSNSERQPEFSQLDIELSFTDLDGVIKLTEDVLNASWPTDKNPINVPFRRISYKDAVEKYGSDKPCLFDKFLIQNMENYIDNQSEVVYMFTIPNGQPSYKQLKSQFEIVTVDRNAKIYALKTSNVEKLHEDLGKILPGFKSTLFKNCVPIQTNDLLVLAKGEKKAETLKALGQCRHATMDVLNIIRDMNEKGIYDFAWVVDFPLFEEDDGGELKSAHHPFTQPHPEDVRLIPCEAIRARALAYDLVLNGSEIGGGSIRIHNAQLQETIFKVLGLSEEDFAHILDAFKMGCPPHGGIALGIDRLITIICARKSIRDVIAFPKSADGLDFMSACPSDIPISDKIRYHLRVSGDKNLDSPQSRRLQETEEEI